MVWWQHCGTLLLVEYNSNIIMADGRKASCGAHHGVLVVIEGLGIMQTLTVLFGYTHIHNSALTTP